MTIVIKNLREKPLRKKHPWIFSGAVLQKPKKCFGEIYPVFTEKGELLGHAYCNEQAPTIFGRMVSWGHEDPSKTLKKSLIDALALRREIRSTDALRLVHAEADFLPGLIIDSFGGHLVIQIATLGMEKLKKEVIEWLLETLQPKSIYEKSTGASRDLEGLPPIERELYGSTPDTILVNEGGISLWVHPKIGQKTGYFVDQRALRQFVKGIAQDKTVLNAFSYTGGFSIAALQGGAKKAISLDTSSWALEQASNNAKLNRVEERHETVCQEAFHFLKHEPLPYHLLILDPPAFAKSQKDLSKAFIAYRSLNTLALKKMPSHSFLVTCSCSHFLETPLFEKLLFEAALQAEREIRFIHKLEVSMDHPMNPFHPESHYLKSFCLYVV